ncbi:GntR family transcriptional regulator, LSA1692 subfamily [Carnobacterium gallinarum]|uniref:GntR family transcriptional regulator, LSA1692 subfamily n=1 Tax=Carnobacterium gallinarum TaxID=2749 RepID=UPI000558AD64|nr:GntR family transcriptional regulator, LSA1692 subfamily [Carnobacterium gallinarum]
MENKRLGIYLEVSDQIRSRISDGTYSSAQKLPSEYELAKEYAVSRLTVRKAIDELIKQDILIKYKGKGTYIMTQQKIQSGRGGLQGFTEAAKAYGLSSETKVIEFKKIKNIPEEVQKTLELETGQEVYHIKRLRIANQEPMTVEDMYIAKKYLPTITKKMAVESLFHLIEKEIAIAYSHQEVEAILVDEAMGQLLQIDVGQPMLLVHSVTFSVTGIPILYDTSYYRADKYTFKNTLHRIK